VKGIVRCMRILVIGLIMVMLAGCGGTSETTPTPAAAAKVAGCQYKFDATVREGPSAGTNVGGTLVLVQAKPDDAGSFKGAVVPPGVQVAGAQFVPVTAQVNGKDVTLTFSLADGSQITGTGTTEAGIGDCRGTMSGSFTGPKANDKGDWLGGAALTNICTAEIGRSIGIDMCIAFIACCK
jgi:hypothetical protein